MVLEKIDTEKIVNVIVRGIFRLGNLLQDHRALALDFLGIETRVEKNIAEQIDRQRQVLVENLGVVAGMFFGGKGVDHAADGVHLLGDLRRAAPLRALEKQMLDEVGNAVLGVAFMARAVLDPNAQTHRTMILHLLRDHADAVVQNRLGEHGSRD